MAFTRVWLVTHGRSQHQSDNDCFPGVDTDSLSQVGVRQAIHTGLRLGSEPVSRILSGSGTPAKQTAAAIAEHQNDMEYVEDSRLNDVTFGLWSGLKHQDAASNCPELFQQWLDGDPSFRFPEGESLDEAADRALAAVNELTAPDEGATLVVVTHRIISKLVVCRLMGVPISRHWQIGQGSCALNLLLREGDRWMIESINDLHHLDKQDRELEDF